MRLRVRSLPLLSGLLFNTLLAGMAEPLSSDLREARHTAGTLRPHPRLGNGWPGGRFLGQRSLRKPNP
uniref:Uncharacterized protein n=1 Tax=Sus scrofa TaxID=9823 RepID=A0A8D1BVN3_PIG